MEEAWVEGEWVEEAWGEVFSELRGMCKEKRMRKRDVL